MSAMSSTENGIVESEVVGGGQESTVRIRNLNKIFRRRRESVHVLRDIDLTIRDGELLVLLGPSGCGKTTLLRCLVGLERPDTGSIDLGGKTVFDAKSGTALPPNRRDVGMVFQNYALWPHMKIAKNVAYPLRARHMDAEIKAGRVEEVLRLVQCEHLADRYPPELSGGQQQRISLARALAPRPELLLLDEPLSNLDALLRIELRAQLRLLHREIGFTGVYVTHDQEEALALGTRVAVMRSGRIEQIGAPTDVYRSPATEYVADFLGARNTLPLRVGLRGAGQVAEQEVREGTFEPVVGEYALRIRPHHLKVRRASARGGAQAGFWLSGARVVEVLPGSEHNEHLIQLGDRQLTAYVPLTDAPCEPGQEIEVGIDPDNAFCYDAAGQLVTSWWNGVRP